jgi:hypothetical protein
MSSEKIKLTDCKEALKYIEEYHMYMKHMRRTNTAKMVLSFIKNKYNIDLDYQSTLDYLDKLDISVSEENWLDWYRPQEDD